MNVADLIKKVRKVEIKSKRIVNTLFAGEYHSAFKGRGLEFSEVREYQYGDDVRLIDWNVTSRAGQTYIKVNHEERELVLYLILDQSASLAFGSGQQLKKDILSELSAIFAFSAISSHDKVGAILFGDQVNRFIPASKGHKQVFSIIREILNDGVSHSEGTRLEVALQYFNRVQKRQAIAIIISDFYSSDFSDILKYTARKHQVIPVWLKDSFETDFPFGHMLPVRDLEGRGQYVLGIGAGNWREEAKQHFLEREDKLRQLFKDCRVRPLVIQ
ncbi:MAG: DUF58 domain-containing protein, partial [Candidatus Margulisiibacteriota bacterium]